MFDELTGSVNSSEETKRAQMLLSLALFARTRFHENVEFRRSNGMDAELLACAQQANSSYSDEEKAMIVKAGGNPSIYFPATDTKRRAAVSWTSDIFVNNEEFPFLVRSTPIPSLPPEIDRKIAIETVLSWRRYHSQEPPETEEDFEAIRQMASERKSEIENLKRDEAAKRAAAMQKVIEDQMVEADWRTVVLQAIDFAATYGTSVLKGPMIHNKPQIEYKKNKHGKTETKLAMTETMYFEVIDPMDCYPSKGAVNITDGIFCQRVRFLPNELYSLLGIDGYEDDVILTLLRLFPNGGLKIPDFISLDSVRDGERNDGAGFEKSSFLEGFELWGEIMGQLLLDFGVEHDCNGKEINANKFYETNLIVMNNEVIYCQMTDLRLGRPLFKATFYQVPGSWWGDSISKKMRTFQRMINAAQRSIVMNMAQCSGPQIVINDISRLDRNQDLTLTPWKLWKFNRDITGGNGTPLSFFQAPCNLDNLSKTLDRSIRDADTATGIPAYSHGSDIAAGAGRTASGLSMLLDSAQRGIKYLVYSMDNQMMRPCIQYLYKYNMINSDDESIKGDCRIDSGGILALVSKDKNFARLGDMLALLQNPLVFNVIGKKGAAEVLRRYVRFMIDGNPDTIVPTVEEMEAREQAEALQQQMMQQLQQQQMMAQGQQGGGKPPQPQLTDGVALQNTIQADPSNVTQYQPNEIPQMRSL